MNVSRRNTCIVSAAAFAILTAESVSYAAGGMDGGHQNTQPSGGPCCGHGGHSVHVPGVHVAGPHISITHGSIKTKIHSNLNVHIASHGSGAVTVMGGYSSFYAPQGVAAAHIGALNVETQTQTVTEQIPITEEYCQEHISLQHTMRAVQAVCFDDKGLPHPASRIEASPHISSEYHGEVYRCMAGTNMQVTLGVVEDGQPSFIHGESFTCRKGEALTHKGNGNLACAPQIPQRSCNERSLLRRHGPGLKVFQAQQEVKTCVPATRTVIKSVQRQIKPTGPDKDQPIILDGGVGQSVY